MDETLLHTEPLPLDKIATKKYDHILDIPSFANNVSKIDEECPKNSKSLCLLQAPNLIAIQSSN